MTTFAGARAALLDGLFDYAGLFPPASLDLPEAMAAYLAHREDPAARLLRRFIAPASRLRDLSPWFAAGGGARPLRLSVLVGGPDDADLVRRVAATPGAAVEAVEARVPADLPLAAVPSLVADLDRAFAGLEIGLEATPDGDDPDTPVIRAVAACRARLGYKLRCGGVTPALIPSVARIAGAVAACRDARVSLKLTAGLHHPVRGMGQVDGAPMHGFLNVVGASLLAWSHGWTAEELTQVVAETDASAFRLDSEAFGWRGHDVPAGEVARLRAEAITGLGTCSFTEPRDDLRTLHFMP